MSNKKPEELSVLAHSVLKDRGSGWFVYPHPDNDQTFNVIGRDFGTSILDDLSKAEADYFAALEPKNVLMLLNQSNAFNKYWLQVAGPHFAQVIQRKLHGHTIEEVAERLEVDDEFVYALLQGKIRPSVSQCEALAKIVKQSESEMLVSAGYFPTELLVLCARRPDILLQLCDNVVHAINLSLSEQKSG